MRNIARTSIIAIALSACAVAAQAEGLADMVGTWKWTDYTVECKEGGVNGISCIVIAGPKNIGLEMVQSKLESMEGMYHGDIKHPASAEIYKTKLMMKDADTWSLDGCTEAGVCAKGDFVRVK